MSEFKVGDEVWYIGADYPSGGDFDILHTHSNNISVYSAQIIEIYSDGELGLWGFTCDMPPEGFYKTKNEAIDAMIKRLHEMREP